MVSVPPAFPIAALQSSRMDMTFARDVGHRFSPTGVMRVLAKITRTPVNDPGASTVSTREDADAQAFAMAKQWIDERLAGRRQDRALPRS